MVIDRFQRVAQRWPWRILLVAPMVLLCHMFDWSAWRAAVTGVLALTLPYLGVPALRLSSDLFACSGHFFRVEISCTIVDAFLGSIPLVWEPLVSPLRNIRFLIVYFICLSVLNLVRLESGFVLFARGIPWWLSHETMAGVFYFALFCWIAHLRRWTDLPFLTANTRANATAVSV
jgi:hypothetical protein